jgi:hypothetical protein
MSCFGRSTQSDGSKPASVSAGKRIDGAQMSPGGFGAGQPWWGYVRLMARKPAAETPRLRHRRRAPGGEASPHRRARTDLFRTPRRIAGPLLLAIGYSLLVWAALFLAFDALAKTL